MSVEWKGKYTCKECGNSRFFYNEVSVQAKRRIDLKNGPKNDVVYDIEKDIDDGFFEIIYCGKCDEPVDNEEWEEKIAFKEL
jgi:hypothetical protein